MLSQTFTLAPIALVNLGLTLRLQSTESHGFGIPSGQPFQHKILNPPSFSLFVTITYSGLAFTQNRNIFPNVLTNQVLSTNLLIQKVCYHPQILYTQQRKKIFLPL